MPNSIRILGVDPRPVVLFGLERAVEHAPGVHWMGACRSGSEVLPLALSTRADVVVLFCDSCVAKESDWLEVLRNELPRIVVLTLCGQAGEPAPDCGIEDSTRLPVSTSIDELLVTLQELRRLRRGLLRVREGAPGFSERELEVLGLVAEGLTVERIALRLTLSRNTVKTHLKRIYRKLQVGGRVEAVLKATRLKLLPPGAQQKPSA